MLVWLHLADFLPNLEHYSKAIPLDSSWLIAFSKSASEFCKSTSNSAQNNGNKTISMLDSTMHFDFMADQSHVAAAPRCVLAGRLPLLAVRSRTSEATSIHVSSARRQIVCVVVRTCSKSIFARSNSWYCCSRSASLVANSAN